VKAAFVIIRSPMYRLYSPIIDAALDRGWEVECWHDYGQTQTGAKAYQFPGADSAPVFRHGSPVVRGYQGPSELVAWLADAAVDAVIWTGANLAAGLPLPQRRPLLVGQQYLLDTFCGPGPANLLACDVIAFHSQWWLEWAADYFVRERLVTDPGAYLRDAGERAAFVGMAELDAASMIDPDEVRRRWGIPVGQPVVVLFPFPQGTGRTTFWPKMICAEPSRWKQAANVLARQRFEYLPHVWHGWNDRNIVKTIRRFCDRNGAFLLVKSRQKTPVPAYTAALADRCVYDEGYYPATALEALSVADLAVSYYSNTVFESAFARVPHLCLTFEAKDYIGENSDYYSRFYTPEEGSAFQFKGVSTAWSLSEALSQLPTKTLGDFRMDHDARTRYLRKFLTHEAGNGGYRTVDAVERALGRPRPSLSGDRTPVGLERH